MQAIARLAKLLTPMVLLLVSLVLYLGFVRPRAELNRERSASLLNRNEEWMSFLEERMSFPTKKVLQELTHWEEDLEAVQESLLRPKALDEDLEDDIQSIFTQWAYPLDEPVYLAMAGFLQQALEEMGPGEEERASLLARVLALATCRANLWEFEKLAFLPSKKKSISGEGFLKSFDVEIGFSAGLTEAVQFIGELMSFSYSHTLIKPGKIVIERIEPAQWMGNVKNYSGPPVKVGMEATILYFDKG